MILSGAIGACIFGGVAVVAVAILGEDFMRSVIIFLAVAVVGAALGVATEISNSRSNDKPSECPEGEVMAAAENDLFQGCVPVDLAEKQLEG